MKDSIIPRPGRHDVFYLFILLAVVVPLRGWLVWNTEVTARDSIGFIQYALDFDHHSWKEVLLSHHQHPGYPLSIWAMSHSLRSYLGQTDSHTMQLCAQLASSLAAVLLIFPMYFLGKIFFERNIAFWGTLLLQIMPVTGQHLSDGISEALFLLLATTSFLFAALALHKPTVLRFTLAGIFCGLAYLTRPEAVVILAATVGALAVRQLIPFWHLKWGTALRGAMAMTVAAVAVGSVYWGVTGEFTRKPTIGRMLSASRGQWPAASGQGKQKAFVLLAAGDFPLTTVFGASMSQEGPLLNRLGRAVFIYGNEGFQLFHYGGFISMILGIFARIRKLMRAPEFLLPCAFFFLFSGGLMRQAISVGYISDRHLMLMGVWGAYFAAAGLSDLPSQLMSWFVPLAQNRAPLFARILLLAFTVICLPRTTQKMHANQAGNHAAGVWLAQQLKQGDAVEDDHNWSQFYSGVSFQESKRTLLPKTDQPRTYTVVTRSKDPKTQQEEERLRAAHGQIVYRWPENASVEQARVVIYALPMKK